MKIKVLLEDDNEILGNGLGHPVYRQYLPTKKYVEILKKIIKQNKLKDFDNAKLLPSSLELESLI